MLDYQLSEKMHYIIIIIKLILVDSSNRFYADMTLGVVHLIKILADARDHVIVCAAGYLHMKTGGTVDKRFHTWKTSPRQ